MKKILSLVLALSMMLALVPAASAETDWSKEEKFTLVWTQYFVAPSAEDAHIHKLLEEKFNVDIVVLPIEDGNFMEVLNASYLTLDPEDPEYPDVMRLKDPSVFNTYVEQESIGAFDMELVKEHFPIYYKAMSEFEGGKFLSYGSVDGEQYGLPAISAGNQFHLPCVYNKTWMENVGVTETPKTLDDLHTLLVKFANEDPDKDGVKDTYGISSDGMRQVFGAYGINPGAADGRDDHSAFSVIDGQFQYDATSPRYKEALKVLHAWYEEGLIDPEFITGENTGGYWALSHSLINQRIGMTVRGNYYHWTMAGDYMETNEAGEQVPNEPGANGKEFAATNPDQDLIYGDPVKGPYGDASLKSWTLLSQIYAFSPALVENEAKFIRVLEIMNYMAQKSTVNEPEVMKAWWDEVYGEKYYYTVNFEGKEFAANEQYWLDYPADEAVNRWGREEWGPTLPEPQVGALAKFAYSLGYDKMGHSTLLQFSLPAMAEYQSNLTKIKDNWMVNFITGAKDIDQDWDAYIKEMNKSGLEKMFKEAKEYYESATK